MSTQKNIIYLLTFEIISAVPAGTVHKATIEVVNIENHFLHNLLEQMADKQFPFLRNPNYSMVVVGLWNIGSFENVS